jgi:hypothetical protein
VFGELVDGRKVKTLTVVDDCTKEAVQIAADTSIPATGQPALGLPGIEQARSAPPPLVCAYAEKNPLSLSAQLSSAGECFAPPF